MHVEARANPGQVPAGASIDLDRLESYSDGRAECVRVSLTDANNEPTRIFAQGEELRISFDFRILGNVGMLSGGIELADLAGCVVHGADSYQCSMESVRLGREGLTLRFRRSVRLDLATGDYTLGIGLASVAPEVLTAYRSEIIGYDELSKSFQEHWRCNRVATVTITRPKSGSLTHHGLVNLATQQEVLELEAASEASGPLPSGKSPQAAAIRRSREQQPSVYHITHWKAGSQWIHQILLDCLPERIVAPRPGEVQFRHWPLQQGMIYPTLYVTKEAFDARVKDRNHRHFVIVRDLRDTLVSAYFSMKVSHPLLATEVRRLRLNLGAMPFDEGMLFLMDEWLPECARIQRSWAEAGERLIRYEDLLERDSELLQRVLVDEMGLPVSRERLCEVVLANRFERATGGRKPGVEDIRSHHRKGVVGDWKNYFSPRLKEAFKTRFGGLLVAIGYEPDLNW